MTSPATTPALTADERAARLQDAVDCLSLDVSEMAAHLRDLITLLEAATGISRYGFPLSELNP